MSLAGLAAALALGGWQRDFFSLAEGFVAVQQSLPELFLPERLRQIPGNGDLVAPEGHFLVGRSKNDGGMYLLIAC